MLKAIIFDMDGVLFDTEQYYYDRRAAYLAQKGISIDHLPPSFFIGGNMKKVWENILGEDFHKWDVAVLQDDYHQYKKDHPLPYRDLIFPDVKKVLESLRQKGLKMGLASSSTKADILRALEETNLSDYFDVIYSGEEFTESKPNPAIYQAALKRLGVTPEQALIIEDSEKGIAAGVAAGVEVWAIQDNRFGMDQTKASRLLPGLSKTLEVL